jgi:hypothetical protein
MTAHRLNLLALVLPCSLLIASSDALAQTSSGPTPASSTPAPPALAPPLPPSPAPSGAPASTPPNVPAAQAALPSPGPNDLPRDAALPAPAAARTEEASHPGTPAAEAPLSEADEHGHTGFAVGFSLGYALPAGSTTGAPNDDLGSLFSGQVPFTLEIGGNATPSLFIGVYGTYAPGGLAGSTGDSCTAHQLDCSAHSVHGGLAIRYRLFPGETTEPWIGYGVGYEENSFSLTNPQTSATASGSLNGWEFGHFSAGVDFLAARMFAFGPFLDVGVGQYGHMHLEAPNQPTVDADITNSGVHEWVTLGLRTVIMP